MRYWGTGGLEVRGDSRDLRRTGILRMIAEEFAEDYGNLSDFLNVIKIGPLWRISVRCFSITYLA